jgi:hypothetical protein
MKVKWLSNWGKGNSGWWLTLILGVSYTTEPNRLNLWLLAGTLQIEFGKQVEGQSCNDTAT